MFRDYAVEREQGYPKANVMIGGTISLFGIVFEAIADYQLHIYKKSMAKGKVERMDHGVEISKDP